MEPSRRPCLFILKHSHWVLSWALCVMADARKWDLFPWEAHDLLGTQVNIFQFSMLNTVIEVSPPQKKKKSIAISSLSGQEERWELGKTSQKGDTGLSYVLKGSVKNLSGKKESRNKWYICAFLILTKFKTCHSLTLCFPSEL